MKVLMLCLRSPYPPSDGGTIAMYNMAYALSEAGAGVKMLAFNTRKHFADPGRIPDSFRSRFDLSLVYLDATVKPWPALSNFFTGNSYNVTRFEIPEFHAALEQLLSAETFDVIQLESLFMTPYIDTIRKHSAAMVVLRAHNVEYVIWQRMAAASRNPLKRWYLDFLSRRLMKYERTVVDRLDALVALTGEDKSTFGKLGCKIPVFVSPIGIDTKHYPAGSGKSRVNAIAHLGSMDWMPNLEGVDWFMKNVYPLLLASGTGFTVHLAGKGMPERLLSMAGCNLEVMGRIEDVNAFFADKQIMIVPLLSGGGMRVKIIEGMAMGKTIISATIGAEGIRYTNGEHILIADAPDAFADAILSCLRNADLCMRIGKAARELAESEYENSVLGARLMEFYSGKMNTGGRKSHTGSAMVNKS